MLNGLLGLGLIGCLAVVSTLQAAVVVGDTFDANMADWNSAATGGGGADATVGWQANVGGEPGAIQVAADNGDFQDYIFAFQGPLAGNKDYISAGIVSVTFDFYAGAMDGGNGTTDLPADLRLYFVSAGSIYWYYDIDPTPGWGGSYFGYGANFIPNSGWYTADSRSQGLFLGDLIDVDQIGLEITYQAWNGQVYGIDNFNLNDQPVPEPGTYALLATMLASLGITFRKRIGK